MRERKSCQKKSPIPNSSENEECPLFSNNFEKFSALMRASATWRAFSAPYNKMYVYTKIPHIHIYINKHAHIETYLHAKPTIQLTANPSQKGLVNNHPILSYPIYITSIPFVHPLTKPLLLHLERRRGEGRGMNGGSNER